MNVSINGAARPISSVDPTQSLAWWARDNGFPEVKIGCEEGTCGACMVLLDGRAVPSCLVPMARLTPQTRVDTVAGLADQPGTAAVARALDSCLQCGFCGPGITVTCAAWLRTNGALPTEAAQVRKLLAGNRCRCTGYQPLVESLTGLTAANAAMTAADAPAAGEAQ